MSNTIDQQPMMSDIRVGDVVAVSTKKKTFGIKAVPLHGKAPISVPSDAEFVVTRVSDNGTLDLNAHWNQDGAMLIGRATGYNAVLFKKITPTLAIDGGDAMPDTAASEENRLREERISGLMMHSQMREIMEVANLKTRDGKRVAQMIVGPAGSGKTVLAEHLAKWLGIGFGSLVLSPGTPESALIGRMTPVVTTGEQVYSETPLIKCFREGGVFLADEFDGADANTMLVTHPIIDSNSVHLLDGTTVTRHKDFIFIAGCNTVGLGEADGYMRSRLDKAMLDRFTGATTFVDYDRRLERWVAEDDQELLNAWWALRERARELRYNDYIVSTRGLGKARAWRRNGYSVAYALGKATAIWKEDERRACGIVPVEEAHNKAGPGTKPKPISSFDQEMSNPRGF